MRKLVAVLFLFLLLSLLTACGDVIVPEDVVPENTEIKTGKIGDDFPVTRALAAKMISFNYFNKNDIENLERSINFNDSSIEKWYDKYINAAVNKKIMSGSGETFNPDDYLTLQQAQVLIDGLGKEKLKIKITEETKNKPISFALWTELFMRTSGYDESNEENLVILATSETNKQIKQNYVITDKGMFCAEGLDLTKYINKEIKIIKNETEIISMLSVENINPSIYNVYITNAERDSIYVFTGGIEKKFLYSGDNTGIEKGMIADIKINGDNIDQISVHSNKLTGKINKTNKTGLEIDSNGIFNFDENVKFYSLADSNVKWKSIDDVIIGGTYDCFIDNNKICAVVINEMPKPDSIRVAINTSGFKSLVHDNVAVSSDSPFSVYYGTERKQFNSGDTVEFSKTNNSNLFGASRIYIKPDSEDGKIIIKSILRAGKNPSYRGQIEVAVYGKGYCVTNEINIDQYLYGVITSQMPSEYGLEASKVQAVIARSNAYVQFYENSFHEYCANIDDSFKSQVYNNIPENEISIKAVDDTKGQCITFNNNVVKLNYFLTSCGLTANSGDVWPNRKTGMYPSSTPQYFTTVSLVENDTITDLSGEENAYLFYKNDKVTCAESNDPWFRWSFSMTANEIAKTNNLGSITDISVVERGKGGNVMKLKLTNADKSIILQTESEIKKAINPNKDIKGNNNVILKNVPFIPSTFFTFDKIYDNNNKLLSIKFYGGGSGHGVGLSIRAAKNMAESGKSYSEILQYFYTGTTIQNML